MTAEQSERFTGIAQMGVACGLDHPYEWLQNYLLHMPNLAPYAEVSRLSQEALEAFLAFFKGCASCPEEEAELEQLTADGLLERMGKWYDVQRAKPQPEALLKALETVVDDLEDGEWQRALVYARAALPKT